MVKKTKLLIFSPYNFLYEPFWNFSIMIIIKATKNYIKKNGNLTKKTKSKEIKEEIKFFVSVIRFFCKRNK